MLTVTDSVRKILFSQDTPLEAMRSGFLNFTAYAGTIQADVEKQTWKQVKLGTIVVALTRISKELEGVATLRPGVKIDDLKIKYPLIDISYEKTEVVVSKLLKLQEALSVSARNVFVMTEGASEVTIIASAELKETITSHFAVAPKALFENLVGVTVSFDAKYLAIQNTLYSLTSAVASRRINIIELVSTYTEIMFVIDEKDRPDCVEALQHHFTEVTV